MESQDRMVIKAPKKTPLLLRTVVLLLATTCVVYICTVCLKQISPSSKALVLQPQPQLVDISNVQPKLVVVQREQHPSILGNDASQANRGIVPSKLPTTVVVNDTEEESRGTAPSGLLFPIVVDSTEKVSRDTAPSGLHPPVLYNDTKRAIRQSAELNRSLNFQASDSEKVLCSNSGSEPWEISYVHYPKPKTYNREECACNAVRYFTIVSQQRSGSRWFETLLNNHTNVSSYGELFKFENRRKNITYILQTMDKLYNLDWFSGVSRNECYAAVGFKWMLNQGLIENRKVVADYFRKKGVSLIFLFRRNMLRRMISLLANRYDGDNKPLNKKHKAHVYSSAEAEILAKYKPSISTRRLVATFRDDEKRRKMAVEYFKNTRHIVLYYEDLIKNRTILRDVQEFLRLPYRELISRQVKIHIGPISEQIRNWDRVQNTLKGSSYEQLLYLDY